MAACPILGFAVQMEPAPGADLDALWRAFNTWLDARGLRCVEGDEPPPALSWLVSSDGGQATDLDREAMVVWLGARGDVSDYGVGPLVDLERTAEA